MNGKIPPNYTTRRDRDRTEKFFRFLTGEVPDGYTIDPADVPKLDPDTAWTVVWYVQNELEGFPDTVERCDVCGRIFHTHTEGDTLDHGDAPFQFCGECLGTDAYRAKKATQPDDD